MSGCDQLVVGPTHACGGTLDFLMTDVLDLLRVKQKARLRWIRDRSRVNWEEFVHCQVRADETYLNVKRQFSVRNKDVLMCPVSSYSKVMAYSKVCCST